MAEGDAGPVDLLGFSPAGMFFYTERARLLPREDASPGPRLRVIDFRRGTDAVVLAVPGYMVREFVWSPSGRRLFAQAVGTPGRPERSFLGGGRWLRLTEVRLGGPGRAGCEVFKPTSFTHDEETVIGMACARWREGGVVHAVPARGGRVRAVSLGLPGFACGDPLASPVGPRLVVGCIEDAERTFLSERRTADLFLADLDGGDRVGTVRRLTDLGPGREAWPELWSPDGRYVVARLSRGSRSTEAEALGLVDVQRGLVAVVESEEGWMFQWGLAWASPAELTVWARQGMGRDEGPFRLVRVHLETGRTEPVVSGWAWVPPRPLTGLP